MAKLKSQIYVQSIIRRAEVAGASAWLVRHGAEDAGAVFLKINRLDGNLLVLSPARRGEGERIWTRPLGDSCDEAAVSSYLERQLKFDPDIWIVEIEEV